MVVELKSKKLKSASLVETIVAMLILMISFAAGMVIYGKITSSGLNMVSTIADMETEAVLDSLIQQKDWKNQTIEQGELEVVISFTGGQRYSGTSIIKATCMDKSGKVISEIIKIILRDEQED